MDENDFYIVFDDLYLDMVKTKQAAFEAMLMHEVGHLINGDLNSGTRDTEIREERLVNLLNGKVDPKELAADRFAVEHCGKNAVIQMLDHVVMTRKKRHTADEVIALKELELRKKAVVRL